MKETKWYWISLVGTFIVLAWISWYQQSLALTVIFLAFYASALTWYVCKLTNRLGQPLELSQLLGEGRLHIFDRMPYRNEGGYAEMIFVTPSYYAWKPTAVKLTQALPEECAHTAIWVIPSYNTDGEIAPDCLEVRFLDKAQKEQRAVIPRKPKPEKH